MMKIILSLLIIGLCSQSCNHRPIISEIDSSSNPIVTDHLSDLIPPKFFFTRTTKNEMANPDYVFDKVAFYLPDKREEGAVPLYRFINKRNVHFCLALNNNEVPNRYKSKTPYRIGYAFAEGGINRLPVYKFSKEAKDEYYFSTDKNELLRGFNREEKAVFFVSKDSTNNRMLRYKFKPGSSKTPYEYITNSAVAYHDNVRVSVKGILLGDCTFIRLISLNSRGATDVKVIFIFRNEFGQELTRYTSNHLVSFKWSDESLPKVAIAPDLLEKTTAIDIEIEKNDRFYVPNYPNVAYSHPDNNTLPKYSIIGAWKGASEIKFSSKKLSLKARIKIAFVIEFNDDEHFFVKIQALDFLSLEIEAPETIKKSLMRILQDDPNDLLKQLMRSQGFDNLRYLVSSHQNENYLNLVLRTKNTTNVIKQSHDVLAMFLNSNKVTLHVPLKDGTLHELKLEKIN